LGILLLIVVAGLVGTPVGSRNLAIVLVWIGWWAALAVLAVPLLGRAWCGVCPLPVPGEWLQRGAVLGPRPGRRRGWTLGLRWPAALRNTWLQTAAFLLLATVAMVVLTRPAVTAAVLALLLLLAVGTSLVFEGRAFCRHLCPVGGFIGVYSQAAPLALRVRDPALCAAHLEKTCVTGSSAGFGCPWNVFPGSLVKNVNCGLCLECVQTCPHDNIGLFLQSPGRDLHEARGRRLDEAFKALVLLGSAGAYAAVMLGPWSGLKAAANAVGSLPWAAFAVSFLLVVGVLVPAAFWAAVRAGLALSASREPVRPAFVRFAYTLVPLGLAAWTAFTLSLLLINGSYLVPALSDPLGRGWDLLGTTGTLWSPYLTSLLPWIQALALLGGLAWSALLASRLASASGFPHARGQAVPVVLWQLAATIVVLWLLIG
jgi:polyferredoxin